MRNTLAALLATAFAWGAALPAYAGGFDLPDNGAQALGRGAAFVAKADDLTAIQYNPAGLARQRGTRLYGGGNLFLQSFAFQRAGVFPDDPNDPRTPWGGAPFPRVTNAGGPSLSPFIAASTDFASFDRLTVAFGVFGPPMVTNRTFPLGALGAPASSRYDFIQSRTSIMFPTGSLAYRIAPWLDLGVSAHLALAKLDQTTVSYGDLGQCPNVEYTPCDARGELTARATSFGATFGALIRPSRSFALGLSARTPIDLDAQGTFVRAAPTVAPVDVATGNASLSTRLPLITRAGMRYIAMDGDFELYDLEVDGTYEAWNDAQGEGPRLRIPSLGPFQNIDSVLVHRYSDTFSVRAGGAYNMEAFGGTFTLRAGGYYDSPATSFAYTRVNVDTLSKVAGTAGLGYRTGAIAVDLGYAAAASLPRVVGTNQGDVRPLNEGQRGGPFDSKGSFLPAVNEGAYRGFTHILAVGLTVTFDALFGEARPFHYGNSYERGYVPRVEEPTRREPPRGEDEPEPRPSARPVAKPEPRAPRPEPAAVVKPESEPKPKPAAKSEPKPEAAPKPAAKPPATPVPVPVPTPSPAKKRHEWWEDPDD